MQSIYRTRGAILLGLLRNFDTMTQPSLLPVGGHPFQPSSAAPDWFIAHLRDPGTSRRVPVPGGAVHLLTWNWGDTHRPTLLFVHGFCGHTRWWSFLMPFFTDRYRVAVMDLPGMGDSDARESYDAECFANAILAVLHQENLVQPTVIGHSFGGIQSIRAMAMKPDAFGHAIIVDSFVHFPPRDALTIIKSRSTHKTRPTQADCIREFRLMPPQPGFIPDVLAFVAHHSCRGGEHGWHWKFDPKLQNFGELEGTELLTQVKTRVDCLYGERSYMSMDDRPRRIFEAFPNGGELVIVPDAYHHLMIDRPLELAAAIRRLLD